MASRPVPGVVATLRRLAQAGAQVAIVTGREAETVLELGGLHDIDGLIASGLHGAETWRAGQLSTLDEPAGMAGAAGRAAGAAARRVWVEDKRLSLVVHTRQAADPERTLAELAEPVGRLAAEHGLDSHLGKLVLETANPRTVQGHRAGAGCWASDTTAALFAGDDLGDLPALAAIRAWSERTGRPGCTIAVGELPELRAAADLLLDSPAELAEALAGLLPEPAEAGRKLSEHADRYARLCWACVWMALWLPTARMQRPRPTDRTEGRIVVDNLTKVFGTQRAVDSLSFTVEPGSVTGFLGPNGAGKTTTLRMLLGLVAPTSGTATINGVDYHSLARPLQTVGAALEAASFHPAHTGLQHLRIYCAAAGLPAQPGRRGAAPGRAWPTRPRRRPRATRWACGSGWAWPAPCSATPGC